VGAPLTALWVTLLVQAVTSLTMAVPAVLAPAVAEPLGFEARQVGLLVSIAYFFAIPTGLLCASLSPRFGPVRLSQMALVISALALLAYATGVGGLMLMGAMMIGISYGIPNPTAAEILSRHAPSNRRGLFFSLKQTGVPLGVALAGVLLPWLLLGWGWRAALIGVAVLLLALALLISPVRRTLEPERGPEAACPGDDRAGMAAQGASRLAGERASGRSEASPDRGARSGWQRLVVDRFVTPVLWVLSLPPLRRLSLSAITFSFTQIVFLNFVVSLLKLEHQMTLAVAAGILATSQICSIVARIFWGHVSDRWIDPGRLLGALGLAMGLSAALLGLMPSDAPHALVVGVAMCCAATSVAWNGVYYADLVRHVQPAEVGKATAATQTLLFLGGVLGAAAFAAVVSVAGSYSSAFAACAALPAIAGVVLLRVRPLQPSAG
jgi:MFS family permease